MNTAARLCRKLVRYQASSWSHRHVMQDPLLQCRPMRQYTSPSPVINTLEDRRQQRTTELKKQIQSGNIVKTALGQAGKDVDEYRKELDDLLKKCVTVDEVLSGVENDTAKLFSSQRIKVLKRIRNISTAGEISLDERELKEVFSDKRFEAFLKSIDVEQERTLNLVLLMENLLPLTKRDTKLIDDVGKKIQENMVTMKFGILVRLMTIYANHQETDFRKEIYEDAKSQVKRRWVETSDPSHLFILIEIFSRKYPSLYIKLQNKALSLTDQMNRRQLIELLRLLGLTDQRNIPLLKNVFHHLLKLGIGSAIPDIRNVLYSVAKLNVYDEQILREATTALYSNLHLLKKASPDVLNGILFSLTKLRYKYEELIDSIVDILMPEAQEGISTEEQIVETLPVKIITSTIVSCSTMNHMPKRWTKGHVLEISVNRLQKESELNARTWLNSVFALVVLGVADESSVASILSQADKREWKNYTSYWKLRDINFSARHEMKFYNGPYLPADFTTDTIYAKKNDPLKRVLHSNILNTLESSFPSQKCFKADFEHPSGLTIDIHMIVNVMGEPQQVENYQAGEELPESSRLVAIVPLDYSDMTKCTVGPNDIKSLRLRHLKVLGYNVVQVPYADWANLTTTVKKCEYLFKKIEESVRGK